MPSVSKKANTNPTGYSIINGRLRPTYVFRQAIQAIKKATFISNSTPNKSITCSDMRTSDRVRGGAAQRSTADPVEEPSIRDARVHAEPPEAMEGHRSHRGDRQRKRIRRSPGEYRGQLGAEHRGERNAAAAVSEHHEQTGLRHVQPGIEIGGYRELAVPPVRPIDLIQRRP